MAEADINELLLLQDKDFNKETKEYAMELYFKEIDEETCTAILWENRDNEWNKNMQRMQNVRH